MPHASMPGNESPAISLGGKNEGKKKGARLAAFLYDPFKIKELSHIVGLPENVASYLVSMAMTIGIAMVAYFVCWPLKYAAELWREREVAGAAVGGDYSQYWLNRVWELLTGPTLGPYTGSAIFPGLLGLGFYFLSCLPMFFMDLLDTFAGVTYFRRWKIRGEERPASAAADWKRTLWCEYLKGERKGAQSLTLMGVLIIAQSTHVLHSCWA